MGGGSIGHEISTTAHGAIAVIATDRKPDENAKTAVVVASIACKRSGAHLSGDAGPDVAHGKVSTPRSQTGLFDPLQPADQRQRRSGGTMANPSPIRPASSPLLGAHAVRRLANARRRISRLRLIPTC